MINKDLTGGLLALILISCFSVMLFGCTSDGGINWGQAPMISVEDPETGLIEGCRRVPAESVIRCEKMVDGKIVRSDFPIDSVPAEIKKE